MSIISLYNIIINNITYLLASYLKYNKVGKFPSFLSIEVSSVCNLKCPQCPTGMGYIKNRKNKYLSTLNFKKIISQFNGRISNLILYFQGEPFMNNQFIDIIKVAHHHKIYTQTSTNAQLINKKLAEQIVKSGLNRIIISIDGSKQESYEKYRVGAQIEKCTNAIIYINYYKKLYNLHHPKIETQMLIFKHNENEIRDFQLLSKSLKVDKCTLKTAQIYNVNDNKDIIPSINRYSRYKLSNGKWVNKTQHKNRCWRIWNGAVINVDGEMLPCCYDKNSTYSYGNVFENNIAELWNNTKAHEFRQQVLTNTSSIDICRNCL